jgi:hypothetical protein
MPVLVSLALSTPDNPLVATSVQSPAQLLYLRWMLPPRIERGGGGMWILRGPFVVTSALLVVQPSPFFRLRAMCDHPATHNIPTAPAADSTSSSCFGIVRLPCAVFALGARCHRPSPLAVHAVFPFISARCVPSRFCSQHSCCLCAWCCPHVAWGRRGRCVDLAMALRSDFALLVVSLVCDV